jgi:branched-chain amino acid transport system ATP-binding protein
MDEVAELASALLVETSAKASPSPDSGSGDGLLVGRGLDVWYGNLQVLFGVDLTVPEGHVLALLGTNGAGKTTLLRTVSGLTRARRGTLGFAGRDITRWDTAARVGAGIAHVTGGRALFGTLGVLDNLLVACHRFAWERDRVEGALDRVLGLFPSLAGHLDQEAGTLSGGEQQMLALAMALVGEPRLLLIDELSLGLAPAVVADLLQVIGGLRAAGVTLVVVEQSVNLALSLADDAVWMDKGAVQFMGPAADLLDRDDLLRAAFLGS